MTGAVPKRNYQVVQGVYAKDGTKEENRWLGAAEADELPFLLNPDEGYIVFTNNEVAPPGQNPYAIGSTSSGNPRAVRISERVEDLIKKSAQKPIRVRDVQDI